MTGRDRRIDSVREPYDLFWDGSSVTLVQEQVAWFDENGESVRTGLVDIVSEPRCGSNRDDACAPSWRVSASPNWEGEKVGRTWATTRSGAACREAKVR